MIIKIFSIKFHLNLKSGFLVMLNLLRSVLSKAFIVSAAYFTKVKAFFPGDWDTYPRDSLLKRHLQENRFSKNHQKFCIRKVWYDLYLSLFVNFKGRMAILIFNLKCKMQIFFLAPELTCDYKCASVCQQRLRANMIFFAVIKGRLNMSVCLSVMLIFLAVLLYFKLEIRNLWML